MPCGHHKPSATHVPASWHTCRHPDSFATMKRNMSIGIFLVALLPWLLITAPALPLTYAIADPHSGVNFCTHYPLANRLARRQQRLPPMVHRRHRVRQARWFRQLCYLLLPTPSPPPPPLQPPWRSSKWQNGGMDDTLYLTLLGLTWLLQLASLTHMAIPNTARHIGRHIHTQPHPPSPQWFEVQTNASTVHDNHIRHGVVYISRRSPTRSPVVLCTLWAWLAALQRAVNKLNHILTGNVEGLVCNEEAERIAAEGVMLEHYRRRRSLDAPPSQDGMPLADDLLNPYAAGLTDESSDEGSVKSGPSHSGSDQETCHASHASQTSHASQASHACQTSDAHVPNYLGASKAEAMAAIQNWAKNAGVQVITTASIDNKENGYLYFKCKQKGRKYSADHRGGNRQDGTAEQIRHRGSTRCQEGDERCPFQINVRRTPNPEGGFQWKVTCAKLQHNHDQLSKEAIKRNERTVKPEWLETIKTCGKLGMIPTITLELLERQYTDDYTKSPLEPQDIKNIYHKYGYKSSTDCRELVQRLKECQKADKRWVVQVKEDKKTGQLTHLFWMSPEQVEAARRFHYLIIHDNTYRCNKYRLHLGCFTTVNEHGKSLLVGQCLVLREREPDYSWQFSQWLEAVGYHPDVIFTDADDAATNAVTRTFRGKTRHFWCIWHIMKGIKKKMGKDYAKFKKDFNRLRRTLDVGAFERGWSEVLKKYPGYAQYLSTQWGGERTKRWAPCYQVDVFTAGVVSTQRAEGTNRWVKGLIRVKGSGNVNKLFDAITLKLKAQFRNSAILECTNELKASMERTCSLMGALLQPLRAVLTLFGYARLTKQVDLGMSMYEVETLDREDISAALAGVCTAPDSDAYDPEKSDARARSALAFMVPTDVEDKGTAYFTVSVLQSTGIVQGEPQHVVLYDPVKNDEGTHVGYSRFFCTCGYSTTFGIPCRHYFAVLTRAPKGECKALFHEGLVHGQWFRMQQPYTSRVPTTGQTVDLEIAVRRPLPTVVRDVPTVNLSETMEEEDGHLDAMERVRLQSRLRSLAERVVAVAVESGNGACTELERVLHALMDTLPRGNEGIVNPPAYRRPGKQRVKTPAQLASGGKRKRKLSTKKDEEDSDAEPKQPKLKVKRKQRKHTKERRQAHGVEEHAPGAEEHALGAEEHAPQPEACASSSPCTVAEDGVAPGSKPFSVVDMDFNWVENVVDSLFSTACSWVPNTRPLSELGSVSREAVPLAPRGHPLLVQFMPGGACPLTCPYGFEDINGELWRRAPLWAAVELTMPLEWCVPIPTMRHTQYISYISYTIIPYHLHASACVCVRLTLV
jgi:hypothetical protein